MRALQTQLTNYALQIAKSFGIELDFSDGSIRHVEKILDAVHRNYKKTKNKDGLDGIGLEFGAYVISVIEKNHAPGKWERDHTDMGKNSFPFYWNGEVLFPSAWCQKRIYDGAADDVWSKYKTFVIDGH